MQIPRPRGPLSKAVFAAVTDPVTDLAHLRDLRPGSHEDAQVTLWALFELHYRGLDKVPDELEWEPALLAVRHRLEQDLELRLRERFRTAGWLPPQGDFAAAFFDFVESHDGPSLSSYVHRHITVEELLQLFRARSIYHLKEADAQTWVVPRLGNRVKAALMELQFDEYGGGRPERLHARLFEQGMAELGLDTAYGAYIDEVPVEVLEMNNAMSMLGLQRRLRGAALGHLAAFEVGSSVPSRRVAQGLARLRVAPTLQAYYEEHVEADAVHEQLAVRTICAALLEDEPELLEDVFFGAYCCLDLEDRFATHLLERFAWQREQLEVPA